MEALKHARALQATGAPWQKAVENMGTPMRKDGAESRLGSRLQAGPKLLTWCPHKRIVAVLPAPDNVKGAELNIDEQGYSIEV